MNNDASVSKVEEYAKEKMLNYDPGHDWWHILRVRKLAKVINSKELSADGFILDITAILHDISDFKFNSSSRSGELLKFLDETGMKSISQRVIDIISNVSYSHRGSSKKRMDPVLMILQDADRLDAIGAIGIARVFSYGSRINNPFFIPADNAGVFEESSIRHFHDKLLKLKDQMNTATGKKLAIERHIFMEKFLDQFHKEWDI